MNKAAETSWRRAIWLLALAAAIAVVAALQLSALSGTMRLGSLGAHPRVKLLERHLRAELAASASKRSDSLTYGWVVLALALVAGAAAAGMIFVGRHRERGGRIGERPAGQREPGRARSAGFAGDQALACETRLVRERRLLVDACVEAFDAAASRAVREQLLRCLAEVGVDAVDVAPGTRFDSTQHKATDTVPAQREDMAGVVATTERVGFYDRGRRVRWPEVVVYTARREWSSGA